MDVHVSVERSFDAGHVIRGDPSCGYEGHGHRFKVRVTSLTSSNSQTLLPHIDDELELLLSEVDGKSLNVMLPATPPTIEGIAMWIITRMAVDFPKITGVDVWLDERQRVTVTRQLR